MDYLINFILCISSLFSAELNTQLRFLQLTGKFGNLKNPKTFSEKLSWLKIHDYADCPLVKQCADKVKVRDYVSECGYADALNEVIGIYKDVEEIDFGQLPQQFVLKWNFGCGYNIICENKSKLNINKTKKLLKKWKNKKFWLLYSETQYKIKDKRIICEKFITPNSADGLVDYKFYCFHGKVLAVLVITRENEKSGVFMTPDWEYLSDIPFRYTRSFVQKKPQSLEKMIEISERLSQPFPFVRVDFFESEGKPVFGEMTFTPGSGVMPSEAKIDGRDMGEYIYLGK